jgi:hypothetical protein
VTLEYVRDRLRDLGFDVEEGRDWPFTDAAPIRYLRIEGRQDQPNGMAPPVYELYPYGVLVSRSLPVYLSDPAVVDDLNILRALALILSVQEVPEVPAK